MTTRSPSIPEPACLVALRETGVLPKTRSKQPVDAEGWLQEGIKSLQQSTAHYAYAGFCLGQAKDQAEHGQAWVVTRANELGVSKSALYDCIQFSRRLEKWSASAAQALLQLEPSKITQGLRKFEPEQIELLASGEEVNGITLDELRDLSVREIVERVRDADPELAQLRKDLHNEKVARETAEMRLKQASAKKESAPYEWPAVIRNARIETTALVDKANICIDDLDQLTTAIMADVSITAADQEAALSVIHHQAHMLAAKANRLVEVTRGEVSAELPVLTTDELQEVVDRRVFILDEHRLEKQSRQNAQAIDAPARRGRTAKKKAASRKKTSSKR